MSPGPYKSFHKREKQFWQQWHNIDQPDMIPRHFDRLPYNTESIRDEHIAYIVRRVKSVDQFDLNETAITNQAISYLTDLERLKELRLKDTCIDDDCVTSLLNIRGLELLHLSHTDLTIDGILRLSQIKTLKTLLVTVKEEEFGKLKTLQQSLPDCELVVNSRAF